MRPPHRCQSLEVRKSPWQDNARCRVDVYRSSLASGRHDQPSPSTTMLRLADGDTGYGNAMNVKRTVNGYAAAGFAGILIEDQVGHLISASVWKQVLPRC